MRFHDNSRLFAGEQRLHDEYGDGELARDAIGSLVTFPRPAFDLADREIETARSKAADGVKENSA